MGCTSAKQVSAVPNEDEGRGKAYSNGDLFADEYKMKAVEEVKYMRGEENRVNVRNQENVPVGGKRWILQKRRKVTCSTGASCRKRRRQTLNRTSTRQRASRSSSGCWMRRLRRGETTARRRRRKKKKKKRRRGHSTKARHPPPPSPTPPENSQQLRPSECVCV
ncbi:uncharacterized protein zgc:92140 isoform X1 [Phycodurus eques]|uniref:uncharacterized protein zgc:92140 isoform X1 n=1 Tax=Phycodurus eques TaxID=693459 RepID=UPI002ACD801C|nr:uncharacterized protein zgc:92140 isoform X1 [Phycodurus eques]